MGRGPKNGLTASAGFGFGDADAVVGATDVDTDPLGLNAEALGLKADAFGLGLNVEALIFNLNAFDVDEVTDVVGDAGAVGCVCVLGDAPLVFAVVRRLSGLNGGIF